MLDLLNLQDTPQHLQIVKHYTRHIAYIAIAVLFIIGTATQVYAQNRRNKSAGKMSVEEFTGKIERSEGGGMQYFVEGGDTIYFDSITASKVYSRLPKQKGKEWRKYYRLVHNFCKAYPYALVVKKLLPMQEI